MKHLITGIIALTVVQCVASIDDSATVVRVDKAKTNSTYSAAIEHHRCIKTYLKSPLKDDANVDNLLLLLLSNGYSIEDLDKVFFALRAPLGGPSDDAYDEQLRQQGVPDDRRPAFVESYKKDRQQARREVVKRLTGVGDEFLDLLMEFVPEKFNRDELSAFTMQQPVDGERLLTDADWMKPEHKRAASLYTGAPKRMAPIPAERRSNNVDVRIRPRLLPSK